MILRFVLTLGAAGFASGFFGPMLLAPDANQGPLFGLLLSGPCGALLGLVLGLAARARHWPEATMRRVANRSGGALALATLAACVPRAHFKADLVQAELLSCSDAGSLRDATVARLNEIEARRADGHAKDWGAEFDRALAQRPGSIVHVHVSRQRRVFEGRARWNLGRLSAGPWSAADSDADYFADAATLACPGTPAGTRLVLGVRGITHVWRPFTIAQILDVQEAEAAAVRFGSFTGDP